ncbi:hypothetical protein HY570_04020 [Candidatus Micrarchaeota archaeon]|nr:hypothetical protein [Candidatus Micrarchaeota archaeon]
MVCWLMFLQRVTNSIKSVEPNLYKRKQLAIEVLKEMEFEESHNLEKMKKSIEDLGDEGLILRAKDMKRRKGKTEKKEEESDEAMAQEESSE